MADKWGFFVLCLKMRLLEKGFCSKFNKSFLMVSCIISFFLIGGYRKYEGNVVLWRWFILLNDTQLLSQKKYVNWKVNPGKIVNVITCIHFDFFKNTFFSSLTINIPIKLSLQCSLLVENVLKVFQWVKYSWAAC